MAQRIDEITQILMDQNNLLQEILEALKVRKQKRKTFECLFDFEAAYKIYPRKEGKTAGMARLSQSIKTQEQYELFMLSVKRYKEKVERDKTEKKFMMMFSTFAGRWQDYLPLQESTIAKPRVTGETNFLI